MEAYLKAAPSDDWAKTTLAVAMLYQSAVPAAKKVIQTIDTSKSQSLKAEVYFLDAKIALMANDNATALRYLRGTAELGGRAYYIQRMKNDQTFEQVMKDPAFPAIQDELMRNSFPCLYDAHIKTMGFFVGYWDVYVSSNNDKNYDNLVAIDSVVKSMGGCSIIEYFNMTPPNNFQGRSFTFYDSTARKIRHNWAGSGGDIYNYEVVNAAENTVQLLAINKTPTGTHQRKFTMTFDPRQQTIRQFIQNSYDDGKSWTPDWDAMFKKRSK
jgi:hypothetical protein